MKCKLCGSKVKQIREACWKCQGCGIDYVGLKEDVEEMLK